MLGFRFRFKFYEATSVKFILVSFNHTAISHNRHGYHKFTGLLPNLIYIAIMMFVCFRSGNMETTKVMIEIQRGLGSKEMFLAQLLSCSRWAWFYIISVIRNANSWWIFRNSAWVITFRLNPKWDVLRTFASIIFMDLTKIGVCWVWTKWVQIKAIYLFVFLNFF